MRPPRAAQIDVGDGAPRTVVSGLAKFMGPEDLVGRKVVVVCNLKPANMKGVESAGMVLCAQNADKSQVELLEAPGGSSTGERITFAGHDGPPEANPNTVKKKKLWEAVAPKLRTDADGVATYVDADGAAVVFETSAGSCRAATLRNAAIG